VTAAFDVLARAQRRAPAVVADLLALPWVGSWAARCTRRIQGDAARPGPAPVRADVGYLGALAAVAAARAGVDADLTTPVRHGRVALPGWGAALVAATDFEPARLVVREGRVMVAAGADRVAVPVDTGRDAGHWLGLRRLDGTCDGRAIRVLLDDLDPFRDFHHHPVAGRLPAGEVAGWQALFAGAWRLLVRHAPARADEIGAGVSALVPLSVQQAAGASATSEHTFGGFALTRPVSAAAFAATMVHEFQHSKMSAILRVVPLYDRAAGGRFYAPWRPDPRPVGGLVQGVYAFLAVADLWGALRAAPELRATAEREFATLREQVRHALGALARSGCLTPAGESFHARMGAALDGMLAEPVPAAVARRARRRLRHDRIGWHLRNRVVPGTRP
jgi:HEXXH motif-containing protein